MFTPFFLATRGDYYRMALGLAVAAAESIADPAATIIVGRIFKDLQSLLSQRLPTPEFLYYARVYAICLVGIAAYSFLMNWLGYMVWISTGYLQGHTARKLLYRASVIRSTSWFDTQTQTSGLAVTCFKDIQDLELAAGITTYEILSMFVGFCVQISVAFYYSWAVTLVCLAGIPVLILIGSQFSPRIEQKVLYNKSLLDAVSERVTWVLTALQTVKIFQREPFECGMLHRQLSSYRKSSIKYWLIFKLQEGLCRAIVLMIFVQGYYFGSYMVTKHGLNAGDVITVFFSCLSASGLLQQLVNHLIEWNKGKASAERLSEVLLYDKTEALHDSIGLLAPINDTAMRHKLERLGWNVDDTGSTDLKSPTSIERTVSLERRNSLDSSMSLDSLSSHSRTSSCSFMASGHVELFNVVFSYPSRQEIVLAGLSLDFPPGSLTFLVGASGSGKSTISSILSKQYPWQAGEVVIDGHSVDLLSNNWIEHNVYVVEQMPKLFDISLSENIKIGSRTPNFVTPEQVETACETACADFVWTLPMHLETPGHYPLSGGQIQRISLARALVNDAPILVLDEATSALDPSLQIEVMNRIISFRHNKTTIVITHDPSIIPDGCPIYLIHDGVSQRFDTVSMLNLSQPQVFYQGPSSVFSMPSSQAFEQSSVLDDPLKKLEHSNHGVGTIQHKKSSTSANITLFKSIPNKPLYFLGLIITTVHAAINPVFSFIFSKLIMGILSPGTTHVTLWAMLVMMCAILDGIVAFTTVILNINGQQWLQSVRERLLNQILKNRSLEGSRDKASYYAKLLLSDTEKCADILTLYWPGLLNMTVLGLVGCIWSMVTGWKLTLASVSLLPAFVVINQWYKWLTTRWMTEREARRSDVMRLFSDLMAPSGFRTLKMQHLERYFEKFYNERETRLYALTNMMVFQVGFGYGVLKSFPYVLESLVLWYGMHLTAHGSYTAQVTMTVFSLIMFTMVTIDQLTANIGTVGTGFEALERLASAINDVPTGDHAKSSRVTVQHGRNRPAWTVVGFHHVEVRLSSGRCILAPFNCEVFKGEVVAIIGSSGAGKSTIARLLLRLQRPTYGEIVVDKHWDLETISDFDVRQDVALVGQMPLDFFDGTIEENLLYALNPNDISGLARMVDVCKECGVHDFVSELKEGYNTRMKTGLLSGGQMQRLGIARALMRAPKMLILDECTSALDQESKGRIMKLIRSLKRARDMIIIIITHQMDVVAVADRVVQLTSV